MSVFLVRSRVPEHRLLFRRSLVQLVAKLVEGDHFVATLAEVAHYFGGKSGLILIVQLDAQLFGTYLGCVPWLSFRRVSSSN